jgi:hypothetical protein
MFGANTSQTSSANYIEDVFSTWLYTGNGSTQTITNGIDLAGQGGLVWIKRRDAAGNNNLSDTNRPGSSANAKTLFSNSSNAESTGGFVDYVSYNSNGFNANLVSGGGAITSNGWTFASWTFREQPKFFDIVTFTSSSTSNTNQRISHNLGSMPGTIILKATNAITAWPVWHRSLSSSTNLYLTLNTTTAESTYSNVWGSTGPTSTDFGINTNFFSTNITYVAYIFAHDAGGFGNAGTDNVISCGSFTTDGSGIATVTLGYEPQWVLSKKTNGISDWIIVDSMRGNPTPYPQIANQQILRANTTGAEGATYGYPQPTATGFITTSFDLSSTYIYIAIRRGPMKTPTVGTSVYTSASRTGTASVMPRWVAGFPVDWAIRKSDVTTGGGDWQAGDRLRGAVQLKPNLTEAETAASPLYIFDGMTGYSTLGVAGSDSGDRSWMFRRAPGFFDVVCYVGNTTTGATQTHNLGLTPELMIVKHRSAVYNWFVYSQTLGATKFLILNQTNAEGTGTFWNNTAPTSSVFTLSNQIHVNGIGNTYVAYLFATVAGVSKVGSYTGNGSSQTINCGFTAGARFILIKRTDSTGDWYVWDSARGIVAGNDPHLSLNTTAVEVTNDDSVDTDSTGFIVNQLAATSINVTSATYIFLAIA